MIQNKPVALITGAKRGHDFEISRQLGQNVMPVLMGAWNLNNKEKVTEMLRSKGSDTLAITLDVTDPANITSVVETIRSDFGRLDVLVNNAAVEDDS